jgi:RNA polymerase sigma-70 factor, ECF subfamily
MRSSVMGWTQQCSRNLSAGSRIVPAGMPEEADAIQRLRRGDIAALEVLVRRYQVRAVRAAYLVVRDRQLAEDVVQSAFLKAFDRASSFDAERPFGPWFLKLVLNDAINVAARRDRETHADGAAIELRPSPEPLPERAIADAETADEIWTALGALTSAQRPAVVQRSTWDSPKPRLRRRIQLRAATGLAVALALVAAGVQTIGNPQPVSADIILDRAGAASEPCPRPSSTPSGSTSKRSSHCALSSTRPKAASSTRSRALRSTSPCPIRHSTTCHPPAGSA